MDKPIKQKLTEFAKFLQNKEYLVRRSWQEALNEFDDSINCLEAKPKALHLMKCDENKKCLCDRIDHGENVIGFCPIHRTDWV